MSVTRFNNLTVQPAPSFWSALGKSHVLLRTLWSDYTAAATKNIGEDTSLYPFTDTGNAFLPHLASHADQGYASDEYHGLKQQKVFFAKFPPLLI